MIPRNGAHKDPPERWEPELTPAPMVASSSTRRRFAVARRALDNACMRAKPKTAAKNLPAAGTGYPMSTNPEEIGKDFDTRIQGTRVKHRMGPTSIKTYDKAGIILRIETTTNNPKWFKHYRTVVHRDGTRSHELARLKKSIYSLHDLRQLAVAANQGAHPRSPAGQVRRTGFAADQTVALPRARQKGGPHLQVLRHPGRALDDDHGSQAQ